MQLKNIWQWADIRKRNLGMVAYILNRLTGIGLTVYLFLHLMVLSTLTRGPEAWDEFLAIAKSPPVLVMDVVLLAGLLIHGLNGLRVTLNGFGVGVAAQKSLFIGLMALALTLTAVGGFLIFTK